MTDQAMKSLSRGMSRDMSPAAIARRLEIISDLRDLAMTLAAARRIGSSEQSAKAAEGDLPQKAQKAQEAPGCGNEPQGKGGR